MKTYYVHYRMYQSGELRGVCVAAKNKIDAHIRATYEVIPELEGSLPYSAWVVSVTYSNGNYKIFNTSEGNPY